MRKVILIAVLMLLAAFPSRGQGIFKQNSSMTGVPGENVTTSDYKEDENENEADTLQGFSFKHLTRGLHHKEPLKPGYALLGSVIMPSRIQIYNKDYWKVPLVFAGIGGGIGGGYVGGGFSGGHSSGGSFGGGHFGGGGASGRF